MDEVSRIAGRFCYLYYTALVDKDYDALYNVYGNCLISRNEPNTTYAAPSTDYCNAIKNWYERHKLTEIQIDTIDSQMMNSHLLITTTGTFQCPDSRSFFVQTLLLRFMPDLSPSLVIIQDLLRVVTSIPLAAAPAPADAPYVATPAAPNNLTSAAAMEPYPAAQNYISPYASSYTTELLSTLDLAHAHHLTTRPALAAAEPRGGAQVARTQAFAEPVDPAPVADPVATAPAPEPGPAAPAMASAEPRKPTWANCISAAKPPAPALVAPAASAGGPLVDALRSKKQGPAQGSVAAARPSTAGNRVMGPSHDHASRSQRTVLVWIGNIPASAIKSDIQELFSKFGFINNIVHVPEKRCAFIDFEAPATQADFIKSLKAKNITLMGKSLYIEAPRSPGIRARPMVAA